MYKNIENKQNIINDWVTNTTKTCGVYKGCYVIPIRCMKLDFKLSQVSTSRPG